MTILLRPTVPPLEGHLVLEDVSWDYYERTLQELDEAGSNVHVTYDRGRMELMSPLLEHEAPKKWIARLIEVYAMEKDIPICLCGSMTCRREDLQRGLEPDECYYVRHMPRSRKRIDLRRDPPPDLAVEVDITSRSIPRQPIYAALGVPEIWRYADEELAVLRRQSNGRYKIAPRSLAFPDLPTKQFSGYVRRVPDSDPAESHRVLKEFQQWARGQ